jgi:hypothetical protein
VWRGKHEIECSGLDVLEIEFAVGGNIGLHALQQSECLAALLVDRIDRTALFFGFAHRHPTRDLQPIRMVGYRGIPVSP